MLLEPMLILSLVPWAKQGVIQAPDNLPGEPFIDEQYPKWARSRFYQTIRRGVHILQADQKGGRWGGGDRETQEVLFMLLALEKWETRAQSSPAVTHSMTRSLEQGRSWSQSLELASSLFAPKQKAAVAATIAAQRELEQQALAYFSKPPARAVNWPYAFQLKVADGLVVKFDFRPQQYSGEGNPFGGDLFDSRAVAAFCRGIGLSEKDSIAAAQNATQLRKYGASIGPVDASDVPSRYKLPQHATAMLPGVFLPGGGKAPGGPVDYGLPPPGDPSDYGLPPPPLVGAWDQSDPYYRDCAELHWAVMGGRPISAAQRARAAEAVAKKRRAEAHQRSVAGAAGYGLHAPFPYRRS